MLAEALAAQGIGPEVAEKVREYLSSRGYHVTEHWLARENRQKAEAKEERQRGQAAELALAIPYAGAIKDCQASVMSTGRGGSFYRCSKQARFVVRRKERPGSNPADPRGDGRLAVCRIHASDSTSNRYHKHWDYERTANEPVEPEYQPPQRETA